MKPEKPQFELKRVLSNGSEEAAEIVQVTTPPWQANTDRRGFLGASMLLGMLAQSDTYGQNKQPSEEFQQQTRSTADCGGLKAHLQFIKSLAISSDGQRLISSGGEGTIKVWSLPEGALLKTSGLVDKGIVSVISPSGKWLASGYRDGRINVWSQPDGALLKTWTAHKQAVSNLIISPDGRSLVSDSLDQTIKFWSLPDGKRVKTLTERFSMSAISPDGKWLAGGVTKESVIKVYRLPNGSLFKTLKGHNSIISALAFSPDGKWLVSGSFDKTIKLWNLPDGRQTTSLIGGHIDRIHALNVSPDGKLLASGNKDGIKLWSFPDGTLLKAWTDKQTAIYEVVISPDGKWLGIGTADGKVKLWNLPDGTFKMCLTDLKASPSDAKGVSFDITTADGQVITYTLPCGSPIPPGATCTCNCVPGSISSAGYGSNCACNKVCTCIPVFR